MCYREEVRCLVQSDPRTRSDATQPGTTTGLLGGKIDGAFILWSALFSCAVTSIAFFALGYANSPHLQGTTNDADFWFLIQATIMQLLGLIVSALLERKSGGLPKWRWALPTAIAGACSITAIPLYLVVPTEWSSFLSLVAGATQSFMVLQYFLSSSAYG
jgi:chromate transport protein ChrA